MANERWKWRLFGQETNMDHSPDASESSDGMREIKRYALPSERRSFLDGEFRAKTTPCSRRRIPVPADEWSFPLARPRAKHGLRERQEITWTFECPIAPHLGSLLNRDIRDVEQLRLWCRSIGRDPIWGTLGPQIVQLISCRSLNPNPRPAHALRDRARWSWSQCTDRRHGDRYPGHRIRRVCSHRRAW